MDQEENRRRHGRVEAEVCAWLTFSGERAVYSTMTLDLGAGGAQFATPHEVRPDDQLRVQIELPGGLVHCVGTVCWRRTEADQTYAFGVRFTGLSPEHRDHLRRFLAANPRCTAVLV